MLADNGHDYCVGDTEWNNGKRSDIILEPKSETTSLPPIIVEIQRDVNKLFMNRAINYCLEAQLRYGCDPILLIFAIESVSPDVSDIAETDYLASAFTIPCGLWAQACYIVCEESLKTAVAPLSPFAVVGEFLVGQALSLGAAKHNDDKTMKLLYTLAIQYWQSLTGTSHSVIKSLNHQNVELQQCLDLLNAGEQADKAVSVILQAQRRNIELKRKFEQIDEVTIASPADTTLTDTTLSEDAASEVVFSEYENGMRFVQQFKLARTNAGCKMNWKLCLTQGQQRGILKYKNTNTLRNQYTRYEKD